MNTHDKVYVTLRPDGAVEIRDAQSEPVARRAADYLISLGRVRGEREGREVSSLAWPTALRLPAL